MSLKQVSRIVLLGCFVLTLASCASHRKQNTGMQMAGQADAYNQDQVEVGGIQRGARFGERNRDASQIQTHPRSKVLARKVYYFDFDSNRVHQGDKSAISKNADYLMRHPKARVMVEGNTDPRGSREYNIGLGERRAKSVAELLAADGVDPSQIRLVSYGAEKRAAFGHSESDYRKDRRVVLVYTKG